MAKYEVTYNCGHTGTVQLFGSGKDRERKIWWLENKCDCPECEKAAHEQYIRDIKVGKAEANADNPINLIKPVELTGSEKQIKWAEDIRSRLVKGLQIQEDGNNEFAAELNTLAKTIKDAGKWDEDQAEALGDITDAITFFAQIDSAKWWIDHRDAVDLDGWKAIRRSVTNGWNIGHEAVEAAFTEWKKGKTENAEKSDVEIAIERDLATMVPENATSSTEATITTEGNKVKVKSDKDEDLIKVLKEMGFRWDGSYWTKGVPVAVADMLDAAAEVANMLLNAGFPVICKDEIVRDMALTGNYNPVPKRYITYCQSTDTLDIYWEGRDDEIYNAAKSIKGAKWHKPVVEVKAKHYADIEGFADLYGFVISPGAREELDKAKAMALASTVKVAPHKDNQPAGTDLEAILERPAEVMDKHVLEG